MCHNLVHPACRQAGIQLCYGSNTLFPFCHPGQFTGSISFNRMLKDPKIECKSNNLLYTLAF